MKEQYRKKQEEERERHRKNQLEELQRKNTFVMERSPLDDAFAKEIARVKCEKEHIEEEYRRQREADQLLKYNLSLLGRITNFFAGTRRK